MDVQRGESKEEEVMGEGIGELEMEELVPDRHTAEMQHTVLKCFLSCDALLALYILSLFVVRYTVNVVV